MTDAPQTARGAADQADAKEFRAYRETPTRALRNRLVERHMGLAYHIAGRYAGRGPQREDLNQVALVALIKAVERFDPERGVPFANYAGRTIDGELKRYFRDRAWGVRTPRSIKQLSVSVRMAVSALEQKNGRSPTPLEVAQYLEVPTDDVVEALAAGSAFRPDSLDAPEPGEDSSSADRYGVLGGPDRELDRAEARVTVTQLLEELPPRKRQIVELRFFENLTQSEIADRVGMSQMHVSRLLRASFDQMKAASGRPRPQTLVKPDAVKAQPERPEVAFTMADDPAQISPARRAVAAWLTEMGMGEIDVQQVVLVLSELLTNAVDQHPERRLRVELAVDAPGRGPGVEIRVSNARSGDADSVLPPREEWGPDDPLAPRGRGLLIVDALCADVRVEQSEGVTTVVARYVPTPVSSN